MAFRIVIIGAGEVGYNLARELSEEDYDITIVDINPEKIRRAGETLDVNTLEGNGASPTVLRQAHVEGADIFLALTRIDEVNLVSSQMARALGAKTIIARLRNTEYSAKKSVVHPQDFGIDKVIHPERAAVEEIERLLKQSAAQEVKEFAEGRLQMVGVKVDSNSGLLGRTIADVSSQNAAVPHKIVAINRMEENFIVSGEMSYEEGDIVYALSGSRHIPDVLTMLGKHHKDVKKIMILGAGKIGRRLAKRLQDDLDVRLVEESKAKAWEVAPSLVSTLVLHGDGTDIDFLLAENIHEMDSFIAVTEDEKTNLVTGLLAKHLGAKHVVVHLSTASYLPIARRIGIDTAVSKNIASVEAIMRVVKSTSERFVSTFEDMELEAVEIVAEEGSKATQLPVMKVNFPSGMVLAAILRDNDVELPVGETQIQTGDRVLLFVEKDLLAKVSKYFA